MDYNKIASDWTDDINAMTFDEKKFCEAMSQEHRTLQQTFTRVCLEWLKTCASENYSYDGRNESSHLVAKQLLDGKEDIAYLPYI